MLSTSFPGLDARLSVICLGVAEHGSAISADKSLAMLDAFAQAGGSCADTAHIYASWLPGGQGQSERALGRWIASRRPASFLVATKGAHPELSSMEASRLAPECLALDLSQSLERLQLSSVGLYWLHRDDIKIPVDEIISALNEHIRSGQIGAIGASNWSVQRITEANRYAASHGLAGFCASQIACSLAQVRPQARGAGGTLEMDDETLKWHRQSRLPLAAYSAQANGFFAHALPTEGTQPTPKQKALAGSYLSPRNAKRHARAAQLAAELRREPNEIALAYVWSQSFPSAAIIGPRSVEQLSSSLRAADLKLSPEQAAWLEGIENE